MLTGHSPKIIPFVAATSLLALVGCAQTGPILSRYTTIGTLKTSLSHLEFENQQLRSRVANLESENRDIENRLVQEESVNGDLAARLDDARNLLSRQGYDWGGSAGATNREATPGDEPSSRALPAGRSTRKPRKPPFARIPGRIDSAAPADNIDDEFTHPRIPAPESFGPQGWRDDDAQWLPIARGDKATTSKLR